MTIESTIEEILNDKSASNWLKSSLRSALARDVLDAASDARFHLFGGKLRTGNAGEYVVAGIIALMCAGWVHLSPASFKNAPAAETSGFIPFFYDWKKEYDSGIVDGAEWKENRLKFI